jgi:uncharacterized protein (TIGR04255 family)
MYYPNAPITEAIIDLRAASRNDVSMERLSAANASVEKTYPLRGDIFYVHGLVESDPGGEPTRSEGHEQAGFKFTSQDEKYVWQSRRDGFTLSRLAPYENWEPFRDEARRLWDLYRAQVVPELVSRVALRYINRIDIPTETVDLQDYFRTFPQVSPDLPQMLGGFFMQLMLPQPEFKSVAIVNQTIIPPPRPGVISIVLDIDIFREAEVPQDEPETWNIFERLHVLKNRVFEACITDKTRNLFQ